MTADSKCVPLAIVVVAALLVNILTFHITMQPAGLPVPIVVLILWVILALDHRPSFTGLLAARTPDPAAGPRESTKALVDRLARSG
jgi:hypothetical protein